jgi:quinol monooxygenase YgiN
MLRNLLPSPAARLGAALTLLLAGSGCAASAPAATTPATADDAQLAPALAAPVRPPICGARIARLWHGRVPNEKADAYTVYIADVITKFRSIRGNLGYQMMRETIGAETHFVVISYWASRDAIKAYAGEDIRKTRAAPRDPEFLIEPEPTVMNYDLAATDLAGCGGHPSPQ